MKRRWVTLFTSLSFVVLAITGMLAFVRPFSLKIIGLHSLMGFAFVALTFLHVANSFGPMKRHLRSRTLYVTLVITGCLSLIFWWQPAPVKGLLGLSGNLGPAQERFTMHDDEMVFQYSPAAFYKMKLSVRTGNAYTASKPPDIAIWLENQGAYHIKTLLRPDTDSIEQLPYWTFKHKGWQQARREAEENAGVDVISSETPNGSFDPADYILPADPDNPMPYQLLIEVNQSGDNQPPLVYSVEIDNSDPKAFQILDIRGYPKQEIDENGSESWALYYPDEQFSSALELVDSALLTIDRDSPLQAK